MRSKIFLTVVLAIFPSFGFSYEATLTDQQIQGTLENNRMREVFERYLATILMYDPERASLLGIHDSDHLLTMRSQENFNDEIKSLTKLRKDMEAIDREVLYPYLQVDCQLLNSMLEVDVYNLSNTNILSKYPQYYLEPLKTIYFIMNKESGNYNAKAASSIKRLKTFPEELLQAERNISHPPKIWTDYAIEQTENMKENISDFFPLFKNYVKFDANLKTDLDTTIDKVKAALDRYDEFLKKDAIRKADGEPASGEYTYGFYLERWHGLDMNTSSAFRYVKSNLKARIKELEKESKNTDPMLYDQNGWKGVLKKITREHPDPSEIVKTFSEEINRASNHFDEYKVVEFPKQRLLIKPIPAAFHSAYPYAFYNPPFPLDDEKVSELYLLLPDEKKPKEDADRMTASLYSYNNVELLVAGLVVPGLHLKYYEAFKNISRIRKISNQPILTNGWMCYSELLAEEMGYFSSPQARLLRLYIAAIRAVRAYVDVGFHTKKMSYEESVDFFMKTLDFPESAAKREVVQISMNPTIGFSYVIGNDRLINMRRRYMNTEDKYFDLRNFHSDFLQMGNLQIDSAEQELKRIRKARREKK